MVVNQQVLQKVLIEKWNSTTNELNLNSQHAKDIQKSAMLESKWNNNWKLASQVQGVEIGQ